MDSLLTTLIVIFAGLFVLLLTGMPIAFALGGLGLLLFIFMVRGGIIGLIGEAQVGVLNDFIWVAVPLFILMGNIMRCGGITRRLYKAVTPWVGFMPGGLLHTNIVSCGVFGACSGSGMAGAATIGTVAIPEMKKRGYPAGPLLGSIAGGGTLASMIPPALPFIVYGAWVGESVGKLFIAGIFPGLMLILLFMTYIIIMSKTRWRRTLPPREPTSLKLMGLSIVNILPMMLLIFAVLGSIYLGIATPTEAAGVGCLGALVLAIGFREANWKMLKEAGMSTIQTTCMVFFIVVGAYVFSMALSMLRVPVLLVEWVTSFGLSPLMILAFSTVLYMVLGCIMDPTSMVLITLSIIYPLMMEVGFDSIWFGVVIALYVEMAAVTPPVGLNLFVIHGLSPEDDFFGTVVKGSMPYFFCMIVGLILLTAFPQIALWLPSKMFKMR